MSTKTRVSTCAILILLTAHAARADLVGTLNKVWEQTQTNVSNGVEGLGGAAKDAGRQARTNGRNLEEHVDDNLKRYERQAKTNAKYLGIRVRRDAKNVVRWIREDKCDREGRKRGPEAMRRCEAEQAAKNSQHPTPPPQYRYSAAIQLDCMKYENDGTDFWGTQTVEVFSTVSQADARAMVIHQIASKSVCAKAYGDDELVDGTWRWIKM